MAKLMYACISPLLTIARGFVVGIACGVGHDLSGSHLLHVNARTTVRVTYEVMRPVVATVVAVGCASIIWTTVAFIIITVLG
jgi:hypothetical protein